MIKKIAEFQIIKPTFERFDQVIYQAIHSKDKQDVWLKTFKSDFPSYEELSSLRYEYTLLNEMNNDYIIKAHSLQVFRNTLLLVLEDVKGISLRQYLFAEKPDLFTLLKISTNVAQAVDSIHNNNVVLKGLLLDAIYIDPQSLEVKIIDLSSASNLAEGYVAPFKLDKSITHYISPELTGKMNRKIDYRSDIYNLGILMYEIFTGVVPFQSSNPFEIVQCHIVQTPLSPTVLDEEIPKPLADIIMKCLAKTPEDRYQSIYGLTKDLDVLLKQMKDNGFIDSNFVVGQLDINDKFLIPERLYGRSRELILLREAFRRICRDGKEWFLISGFPGIGKTFLFKELHKTIIGESGFIISGKFELLQHHIPFSALIQAFKQLVHEVLKNSDEKVSIYRKQLLAALQTNGQILIDFVPELELIIGKQPFVSQLAGEENRNRLLNVIIQFITVFAKKEHPLVLFLDDLQWADAASLYCIKEMLLDRRLSHLLIIGAYRSQDVTPAHSLFMVINEAQKEYGIVNNVHLEPLKIPDIITLISDTLHYTKEKALPLAEYLAAKTGGNPFFINQLLRRLYEDGIFKFDYERNSWEYDLVSMLNSNYSNNIVDLLMTKIKKYPIKTQNALSLAAAIGPYFTLNLLAKVGECSKQDLLTYLQPVLKDELIRKEHNHFHVDKLSNDNFLEISKILEKTDIGFLFLHSKIYEASDALENQEDKFLQHYKIGSLMLKDIQDNDVRDEVFFETLTHLNFARSLVTDKEEKRRLTQLNLEACLKAKNSAAYSLAYEAITVARYMLPKNPWEMDYELTYSIYLESAECAFYQKKFEDVESLSQEILKHAKTTLDKAKLYLLKMTFYTNSSEYNNVIDIGIKCAELFGFSIPKEPNKLSIVWNYLKLKNLLGKNEDLQLEKLPQIKDPNITHLVQVLVTMAPAAFLISKNLFAYVNILGMQLTLKYGNCGFSSFLYSTYGIILQSIFQDYKTAYNLALTSIKVAESSNSHTACCKSYFAMAMLISHWTNPLKKSGEYLNKCYLHGLDSGELFFLSYVTVFFGFADGTFFFDLRETQKRFQTYASILFAAKNRQAIHSHTLRSQILKHLMSPNFRGLSLSDEQFNEEAFYEDVRNNQQFRAVYQAYVAYKSMLLNYFGYYRHGVALFDESSESREAILHFMTQRDLLFFHSLNLIGLSSTMKGFERYKNINKVKHNQNQLKKWTQLNPTSNIHRYYLVEAELARISGHKNRAFSLYDDAIRNALENDFICEAGLANELAAKYYLQLGKTSLAKAYMREAHSAYYRWGALSKTSQLEELYPQLLEGKAITSVQELTRTKVENKQDSFNMTAVLRASAGLSKEIILDKLLNEILKVLIAEGGADRAIFIMGHERQWIIQGEIKAGEEAKQVLSAIPYETAEDLSTAIVSFVLRTQEKVVINDVTSEGMFSNDLYLNLHQIKAVLCIPVIYQGKMSAILYLENTSQKGVFTADKIRILELLTAQISTSIENSILYSRLEQYKKTLETKVQERTVEIQQKNKDYASALDELKNTQNHLIESEKLAALGQLIAGIAHEVNTPLGAVRASTHNVSEAMKVIMGIVPSFMEILSGQKLELFLQLVRLALEPHQTQMSAKEERQFKRSMSSIYEEKHIPHAYEIVDTLFDMNIYQDISDKLMPFGDDALPLLNLTYNVTSVLKNNQNILLAVERASKIIFALKSYVHQEKSESMEPTNIAETMESVLTLYHHQLKQNVVVERHFQATPDVACRANELSQVWTNLIHNALQAMNNKGMLEIKIFPEDKWVVVQIIDSGAGIPETVKPRLFTPFFTTKNRGEGSGLGLSISKKIIEAHFGEISFESAPGRTVFTVKLPGCSVKKQNLAKSTSLGE